MGMRPRTFRRLILVGSLVVVLVAGAIGFFIVAPMQSRRNIEKLRTTGMNAYAEGDYAEAAQSLRRFLRNSESSPPEELLAFARSQAKVQVRSGGHLKVSIRAYRDYMILRPDDMEVSAELLHLFNRAGMWPEARSLGESMRARPDVDLSSVLFEVITARSLLDDKDSGLGELYEQALSLGEPDFPLIWSYSHWLTVSQSVEDAVAFLDEMIVAYPDRPGARVLRELPGDRMLRTVDAGPDATNPMSRRIAEIIGWDDDAYLWDDDAHLGSLELGNIVARAFHLLGRPDLAIEAAAKTVDETQDPMVAGSYARWLWWANQDERLLGLEFETAEVLGFKILAASRLGDTQSASRASDELLKIDTDYRAKGWSQFLRGVERFDAGELVEARGLVSKGIDTNPTEPVFYLVMGDIHSSLGREGEAIEKWKTATQLVKTTAGVEAAWAEPTLRIVTSLHRSGNLSEAERIARLLMRKSSVNPDVQFVWLKSQEAMAREGLLDLKQIETALGIAHGLVGYLPETKREILSTPIIVLYAESGQLGAAGQELARTIRSSPSAGIFAQVIELDRYYDLGVIDPDSVDFVQIAIQSPSAALGFAQRVFFSTGDRQRALDVFAQGIAANPSADQKAWDLVRVRFLDINRDAQGVEAWRELLAKYPDDIEILLTALDSDTLGRDGDFVDSTITHILELTSSKGRAEPSRFRLARVRAMAAETDGFDRAKRDEALSIVRSVIVADPKDIKARLMLSNILDLECSANITGEENRFVRDRAGAAAERLAISRLIAGPSSRDYLFLVSKLNVDLGDSEAARQNLLEVYARSAGDLGAQFMIIQELRRANEYDLAIPLLTDLVERAQGSQQAKFRIALARMLGGLNKRSRMLPVLRDLAASDELTDSQLLDLINLYVQTGHIAEAEQLITTAGNYGLDEQEIQRVRVQYAIMTGSSQDAERMLRSMIDADDGDARAFVQLADLLTRDDRIGEAQSLLEQGFERHPDDEEINYRLTLLRGDRAQINQMVSESGEGFKTDEEKNAMRMIVEFENARESMSNDEIIEELYRLAGTFPNIIAVQRYCYGTLIAISTDYGRVASGAETASRQLNTDVGLLEIATRGYIDAGNWIAVNRTTNAWRGKSTGSPIHPDIYAARAAFELRNFARTKELLWPYFESASRGTDDPMNRELLFIYSKASIAMGDPASQLAAQLEPIAISSPGFRYSTWLGLAVGSVPEYEEASRWILLAQSMSTPETHQRIVEAWLQLARRFPQQQSESLANAVMASEQWLASDTQSPIAQSTTGTTLRQAAESLGYGDPRREANFQRALGLFNDAASLDPENLNHLFNAAQCADALGDYSGAIERYRGLLGSEFVDGIFRAAIKNNLARAIEQTSSDPEALNEASELLREAIAFQEHPAFVGSLGWIELKLGNQQAAAARFSRVIALDSGSVEGWAGLAVSLRETDAAESQRALRQMEKLIPPMGIDPTLSARMSQFGVRVEGDSEAP